MKYFWSIILLLAILLGNVLYIFQDRQFFHTQFVELGSYERQETVMEEAQELMQYWRDEREFIDREVYSLAEEKHLLDVKEIVQLVFAAFLVMVLVLLLLTGWFVARNRSLFDGVLFARFGTVSLVFLVCVIGILIVGWFAWDRLFDSFHRLFFVDNRTFSSNSFLIQSYPWEFFCQSMVTVFLRSVLFLYIFLAVLYFYRTLRKMLVAKS